MGRIERFVLFGAIVCFVGFFIAGCESTEDNNIAKAQKCLDGLGVNPTPSDAQSCLQPIAGDYSANAEVVRCAADFMIGGITDQTLINAYNAVKNLTGSAVAQTLVSYLTQPSGGPYTNTNLAQTTYNDCQASGVSSLMYLAGLSYTGTQLAVVEGNANPSDIATACQSSPSSCNPQTIGSIAQTVYGSYCTGSNQTNSVCTTLNSAISSGNGNPSTIGQNLINLL